MILKPSDFSGEFLVPNLEDTLINSNLLGNTVLINKLCDNLLPRLLVKLLGFNLYNELKYSIDLTKPNRIKYSADLKYADLLNGKDGFIGLVTICTAFIYYNFLRVDESEISSIGVVKSQSKSASAFSPRTKAVDTYSFFIKECIGSINENSLITWGGYFSISYSADNNVSLLKFINDNKVIYNNAVLVNKNDAIFNGPNEFDL